jgi:hypothetical protein
MIRKKFVCLSFLILLWMPGFLHAAELHENAGKTVVSWMKIGVSGRAAGMGESYVTICNDASAMFWNPAGLIEVDKPQIMTQYGRWFAGTGYHAAGFAKPILDETGNLKRVLAMGITYFDSGRMRLTESLNDAVKLDSELTSEDWFTVNGSAILVSYARRFNESISMGYTIKLIGETMLDRGEIAFAVDAGMVSKIGSEGKYNIGMVVQNIGTKFNNMELPQNIKVGTNIQMSKFLVGIDLSIPNDSAPKLNTGVEFKLTDMILLRCGYMTGANQDGLDMLGLSAGIGLNADDLCVDIAFVPFGVLGDTYRTSIILKF